MIIIGYGTGRCGTKSLAAFLKQQGFDITHEGVQLGWYQAFTDTEIAIRNFFERKGTFGDVGFYWINYLDLVLRKVSDSRAINIWRDDDEVIESFWSYMKPDVQNFELNNWKGYPFDSDQQTKDAIAFTIKRYRVLENEVRKMYPASIYTIKTEDLNNEEKMNDMLEWINSDLRVLTPVHTNTREEILSKNAERRPLWTFKERKNERKKIFKRDNERIFI